MANNLFISYDLHAPDQNYEAVIKAIKTLGSWAHVQKSFWYVNSSHTAESAVGVVWKVMDANDSLIVVDASNGSASWQGKIDTKVGTHIKDQWSK